MRLRTEGLSLMNEKGFILVSLARRIGSGLRAGGSSLAVEGPNKLLVPGPPHHR